MADSPDLSERLRALEARVAALEGERSRPSASPSQGGDFWALDALTARHPGGAVVFAGHVALPTGAAYGWQQTVLTPDLLASGWEDAAPALAALGHPLRLTLLRAVLHGQDTAAAFQAHPELAGAGKLYHHLRELQAAGWLVAEARGRYGVPAGRVVPLLVILRATDRVPAVGEGEEAAG